ncbi:MAG: hypothetical protein PSX37_06930, partial [bacterium]|nr:hypothetical protein [bacterium]
AKTVKEALKSALEAVRTSIKAELAPLHDAKDAARSAYFTAVKANADAATLADLKAKYEAAETAYKAAAATAEAKYKTQVDAATATAKSALDAAEVTYVTAVKAAFAPAEAPAALLAVPGDRMGNGHHFGWGHGHGNGANNGQGHGNHGHGRGHR